VEGIRCAVQKVALRTKRSFAQASAREVLRSDVGYFFGRRKEAAPAPNSAISASA
jgi:hypothetical protein